MTRYPLTFYDKSLPPGVGAHALLYMLSDRYKLWFEVQAYKRQAQYYADDRRLLFAGYISKYYKLDISTERAYAALITPRCMDTQTAFNVMLALVAFLGGWVLNSLRDNIRSLQVTDAELADKVQHTDALVTILGGAAMLGWLSYIAPILT